MNDREHHSDFRYDSDSRLTHAGLKQRLAGAIALVSLAVIFLPMIFDQPREEKNSIIIAVPDQPPEKIIQIEKPKRPVLDLDHSRQKNLDKLAESVENAKNEPGRGIAESVIAVISDEKKRLQATREEKVAVTGQDAGASTRNSPGREKTDHQAANPGKSTNSVVTAKESDNKPGQPAKVEKADKKQTGKQTAKQANRATFAGKWMVQLGSFGARENALNLAKKIRQRGFMVHTLKFRAGSMRMTKVLVGPFEKKADASKAKKSLDLYLRSKSLLVKY
ncbi:MAG: hypothetical protein CSA52_03945 [Gammaproteobacteria bacterium]|nr:MAG: hypothetical protein CSB48_10670 [Pseudomonadota bacterium]PIE38030.1 MAG: hypothetical protein CSA52_03945 [Gammaproteobacteria bacterium]